MNRPAAARAAGNDEPATLAFAQELIALGFGDLTAADRAQVERLLLDYLACALKGADLPWNRALRQWAKRYDGTGRARLIGTRSAVAPVMAALVNGAAAHGLELDDTHDESVSHPGSVVISAALAVGAERGADGRATIAAIVAGYEAMARVGMATGAGAMIERGFHPTAVFGAFGATAAAAKLLGLDADGLASAWGLVLSLASGAMQFSDEAGGTDVKRLHAGYAAQHGVQAAELAAAGLSGPRRALDGRNGAIRLFGEAPDVGPLRAHAGPREIHRVSFKFYPCCRLFHSTLDALAEATDNFQVPPEAIATIRVGGPTILATQHMLRRPTSVMAAQYALPFTLATAFFHGPRNPAGFRPEVQRDARVLAIADRVEAFVEEEHDKAFPRHFGSSVDITFADGRKRRVSVLDSVGTPAHPPTNEDLRQKLDALVADTPFALASSRAQGLVAEFATLADVSAFLAELPHD